MDNDLKELFDEAESVSLEGGATSEQAKKNAAKAVEDYKFRCEVREIIRIGVEKGRNAVEARIGKISNFRGEDAANNLRSVVYRQRKLGNDGEQGKWMPDQG